VVMVDVVVVGSFEVIGVGIISVTSSGV